jgi:hypothetical protein
VEIIKVFSAVFMNEVLKVERIYVVRLQRLNSLYSLKSYSALTLSSSFQRVPSGISWFLGLPTACVLTLADVYQAKPDTLRKPKNLEILLSIE